MTKPFPLQRGQRFTAFGFVVPILGERSSTCVPFAIRTNLVAIHRKVLFDTRIKLVECHGETLHHVFGSGGTLSKATHSFSKNRGENVVEVGIVGITRTVLGLLETIGTQLVINLALFLIRENIIRFFDLLELEINSSGGKNFLDIAASVRMMLHCLHPKSFFDFISRCVRLHFQQIVVLPVNGVSTTTHIPS